MLRKIALGELDGFKTGFASTEKPWLKYYSENDVSAIFSEETAYRTLINYNNDYADNNAFHYYGLTITYRTLFDKINETADAFVSHGISYGDVVVISSLTIPEIVYSFYALNKIGAIPNMVDPRTSLEGINYYCNETNAKCFITLDPLAKKMTAACKNTNIRSLITIDPANSLKPVTESEVIENDLVQYSWNSFISSRTIGIAQERDGDKEECCVIVHTGGTTGLAKSVMLSNANINSAAFLAINSPLKLTRHDSFLNLMPPFISYGVVIGLHTALIEGWEAIIIPQFELNQFDELVMNYKPNGIMGVPAYFESLMNSPKMQNADLSFIKAILVGGDNISTEFEKKINMFLQKHNCEMHLSKGYSMTEASASGTLSYENANRYDSAGIPMSKTIIAAFDINTGEELPLGASGELCMSTPTMMIGYFNNVEETNKVIRVHKDGRRWIHTGDIGYIDHDGFVFVEGRLKRIIIRHDGFKVFPAQIEDVIKKSESVEHCCAIGVKDKDHVQGMKPIVYFTRIQKCSIASETLIGSLNNLCRERLPEYEQPFKIIEIESMPLTSVGKIDFQKLEKMALSDNEI